MASVVLYNPKSVWYWVWGTCTGQGRPEASDAIHTLTQVRSEISSITPRSPAGLPPEMLSAQAVWRETDSLSPCRDHAPFDGSVGVREWEWQLRSCRHKKHKLLMWLVQSACWEGEHVVRWLSKDIYITTLTEIYRIYMDSILLQSGFKADRYEVLCGCFDPIMGKGFRIVSHA